MEIILKFTVGVWTHGKKTFTFLFARSLHLTLQILLSEAWEDEHSRTLSSHSAREEL